MDLEIFYPAEGSLRTGDAINACSPRPVSTSWMQGEPLDIDAFLRTPAGKPRVSIFSIAHLDDAQRMFFVSLLLNAVIGWMRGAVGHVEPARAALHGRDLRVLPAGRQPAVEGAAVDAVEAGPRVRTRHRAGHAEPGRSRLQGAVEHRHLVARSPADRTRQGARARRTRRRARSLRLDARRSIGCSRASPAVCSSCATSTRTA